MALTFVNQIGAGEGMSQAAPGTLIPESFLRWSQDILFDKVGLIRRRGAFEKFDLYKTNATTGLPEVFDFTDADAEDERILAVLSTYDPTGAERIGMLVDSYDEDTSNRETILRVFDNSFTFLGEEVLPFDITPLSIVTAKPALGGGLWVSIADNPADSDTHYQFFWRGGYGQELTVRSATLTASLLPGSGIPGTHSTSNDWASNHKYYSKTINVSTTNLSVGMFVYAKTSTNYYYVGVINQVNASDIVLEKHPFIWASGSGYDNNKDFITLTKDLVFVSVRPYEHLHGRGLLNTTHNGTTILSGDLGTNAEGHWKAANVGNYFVYRSSDNICLGKINYTTDNKTAVLIANPGIDISADEYIMKPLSSTNLTSNVSYCVNNRTASNFSGLYTAVYAGYQWYGNFANDDDNTNRVVFSAAHNKEAVDLSTDAADSIIFPGKSKFRGLGSSSAGLLVFLEDRTYILRGNDRTNFSVEQLVPEGCLCPSSIVEYGGGVFWAGKTGIMYFDGASVRNLTRDNLGLYYSDSLDVFNPEQDRVIGFMHKNNLIMHYTSWKSPFDPIRYEPLYANDWINSDDKYGKDSWDEFDPDFEYDDFFTENNTPIYWDQKKLNNPEESASTGTEITYGDGVYARDVAGTSTITTLTSQYIFRPDIVTANQRLQKWNGTQYATVSVANFPKYVLRYTSTVLSYTTYSWDVDTSSWVTSTTGNSGLWGSISNLQKWGPLRKNTSMTFSVYLPTNALTTLSNMDPRGSTSIETVYGLKTIVGVNSVENNRLRARLIDIHPVYDVNTLGQDAYLVEKLNIPKTDLVKGPDFYLQTKHFTVGDPILRKWFQRTLISMLLYDGAIRMDLVDDDDNDDVDINKKKHRNWEVFTEKGYDWDYLGKGEGTEFGVVFPKLTSPNKPTWGNVENTITLWDELFTADFNRYSKRISWRKPSVGFRLYQLNNYKKPFNGVVTVPNRIEMQGFSIGFKPLRQGRI